MFGQFIGLPTSMIGFYVGYLDPFIKYKFTTSVVQRVKLWPLDPEVPGSIPGGAELGNELLLLFSSLGVLGRAF